MADDAESVRRGAKVVRWTIGIIFAVAIFTVDSPSTLIGGAFLGWWFGFVGQYAGKGNAGDQYPSSSPISGSAWVPKPSATPAEREWRSSNQRPEAEPDRPASLDESGNWPPPDYAIRDGVLYFSYADADGVVSDRQLINWGQDSDYDHCFSGFDLTRRDTRTFRIDRVQDWG